MRKYLNNAAVKVVVAMTLVAGLGAAPGRTASARSTAPAAGTPKEFAFAAAKSKLSMIDAASGGVAGSVDLGRPVFGAAVSPGGTRVYVTNPADDTLSVVSTSPFALSKVVHVGDGPRGLAVAPDDTRVYVADYLANKISVVDTTSDEVVKSIGVGIRPISVAFTPDGTKAFVVNDGANSVSVIDTGTYAVHEVSVGQLPQMVTVAPDGAHAYVVNAVSDDITVIDTATRRVTSRIATDRNPRAMAISPDGGRAYVGVAAGPNVEVIDLATGNAVNRIGVGNANDVPLSVAIGFDGGQLFVGLSDSESVAVISTATNMVTASPGVGGLPYGLAVGTPNTAVVMLGDSFVSGNAGRWQGNAPSPNNLGDFWGTDRAAYSCHGDGAVCRHDAGRVYGNTASTCMRSDSSEIRSAGIQVAQRANLACSGAKTVNLIRAGRGGQSNKGEAPQIDQLATLLTTTRVKMVVVTIGGNDLGFGDIITSCIARYTIGKHCEAAWDPTFTTGLQQVRSKIAEVVRQVTHTMEDAGYRPGSYRFVLQSYPSPIPLGDQNRYPQSGLKRVHVGHCPIYDDDSDWVHQSVVPRIADLLKDIAAQHKIEFLDLRTLLDGHEVCSKGAQQSARSNSLQNPLPADESEWARFFDGDLQGSILESVHPNYYGQLAMGSCLTALYAAQAAEWNHRCTNVHDKGPEHVDLTSTSAEN